MTSGEDNKRWGRVTCAQRFVQQPLIGCASSYIAATRLWCAPAPPTGDPPATVPSCLRRTDAGAVLSRGAPPASTYASIGSPSAHRSPRLFDMEGFAYTRGVAYGSILPYAFANPPIAPWRSRRSRCTLCPLWLTRNTRCDR